MADLSERNALIWVLRRPLARPGRLVALFAASLGGALLGGISLTSAYPLLVILFDPKWHARLEEHASGLWPPLQPLLHSLLAWIAGQERFAALTLVLVALLATMLLAALAQLAQDWLAAPLVHGAVQEISTEAHDALLQGAGEGPSLAAGGTLPRGDLLSCFTADLDAVRITLQKIFSKVVHEPFKLLLQLGLLVAIDGRLALVMGVLFPLAAGFVLFLSRRLRDTARRSLAQTGELVALVEEGLRGRRVVRAFGLEERERRRFLQVQAELTRNLVRLDRHEALSGPLLELLVGLAATAVILIGASRVLKSELSPEALLTFFAVLAAMLDPMRKLADTQVRVQRGAAAARRLKALVDSAPQQPPIAGSSPFHGIRQGLALEQLGVRGAGGAVLLDAVDLAVEPGEVVLVAGRSGAGKSTLLDVLAGLRRYDAGAVRIDGVRLEALSERDFRERVGLVTQETFLFRGTIAENITLGRPQRGVPLDEALAAAGIDELVARLPDGPGTLLEERAFSAGERQRLSIARALYRNPALLLLDEATSALDRPVEAAILARLLAARAGRITFLVTHRLAPDLDVDRVLLLERGRVVATGSPQALLVDSPLYRELATGAAAAGGATIAEDP